MNRRTYFQSLGAAGISAAAVLASPVEASVAMPRNLVSQFSYPIKTFAPETIIKVGMIGVDGHTETILGDIPKIKNVQLTSYACYGASMPPLQKGVKVYDRYEEMLEKEELDVVGICLPYSLNAGASIAAAKKKLHIVTEKPIAITIDDLESLRKAVISNRVRLTALLSMRLEPAFLAVRETVAAGRIGEPILVTAQKSYKFGQSRPDFYKKKETYGGTIPWVGIHALDYIHFTTDLHYTEVVAFHGNKDHPGYPGFEDYAGILLRLSNGGTAMVNIDYLRPETASTHGDDRLRIVGAEGVIEIKELGTKVELITSSRPSEELPLPERKPFFADFISELRGEGRHVIRPEEPFEMTRVALLAYQSAEKNMQIWL
jgi:predicted dehydrogenase